MKLHRFYLGEKSLDKNIEITEKALIWQWYKVLRFQPGQQLSLFNSAKTESLYKFMSISKSSANLLKLEQVQPSLPSSEINLFWSLLKRDNNDLILQKCTELGISNFTPLISERTVKKDFNIERAKKIVIEASEQCGRTSIPGITLPVKLEKAINLNKSNLKLIVATQEGEAPEKLNLPVDMPVGLFIGPEGGWSDDELKSFEKHQIPSLKISEFTLRAETAAIVATSKLL